MMYNMEMREDFTDSGGATSGCVVAFSCGIAALAFADYLSTVGAAGFVISPVALHFISPALAEAPAALRRSLLPTFCPQWVCGQLFGVAALGSGPAPSRAIRCTGCPGEETTPEA